MTDISSAAQSDQGDKRRRDWRGRIGQIGEDLAEQFVRDRGWVVLDRNWRTRYGELDLVAADGQILVVVEVKTRASRTFDDPVAAVTPEKLSRMRRLAQQWLAAQDRWWSQIRFDVISVQLDRLDPADTRTAGIRHHVGVYV